MVILFKNGNLRFIAQYVMKVKLIQLQKVTCIVHVDLYRLQVFGTFDLSFLSDFFHSKNLLKKILTKRYCMYTYM